MLNDIKSKFILKMIILNIPRIKMLKIIMYNKKLLDKLDITIKDYKEQKLINDIIKKLNRKYHLGIKDNETEYLDLNYETKSNIILKEINKIGLKNLKYLNLSHINYNNIYLYINILEKCYFPKLEVLNLSFNRISDIKILEKVNFKELIDLDLSQNYIYNINALENVNFKNLKELFLNNNNISDIQVLERVKFDKLKLLNLGYNNISDINILEKVNFKDLETLFLDNNKISNIEVFENSKLINLERLELTNNNIDKDKFSLLISNLKIDTIYI